MTWLPASLFLALAGDPMITFFVALAVGIISYFIFVLLFPKAVSDGSSDYTRLALDRLYRENQETKDQNTILKEQLEDASPFVRFVFGLKVMAPIYELAVQAGYLKRLHVMIVLMSAGFFGGFLILWWMGVGAALSLITALMLGYLVPLWHCRRVLRRRNRKFIDQFPDALDTIVRSVRSGFPLSTALKMLADTSESPVKEEFRQVVDELSMGRALNQALSRLAARINEPDIRFFVVVLVVQQETGGNLAEIVGNLSSVIRKRRQLRHKIRAMTSEGRATAWILGLLPVFVFGILYTAQPNYLMPFFTEPVGHIMLLVVILLIATSVFIVRQMVNVDI